MKHLNSTSFHRALFCLSAEKTAASLDSKFKKSGCNLY